MGTVQGLLVILALVAMGLLLPVLLPLVAMLDVIDRWRKMRAVERFACVRCGRILGREGLQRGDEAWREHFTALHRRHPNAILRVVRDVYAVCPRCGARHGYDEATRTFPLLPPLPTWFQPEEIDRLVQALPVREPLPFDSANDRSVRAFYGALVAQVEEAGGLRSHVEWSHYGSGYASFVEAWFYPADGRARLRAEAGEEHHAGLVILFSRLSRYFVLSQDEKRWAVDGSSSSGGVPCFAAADDISHPALRLQVDSVTALLAAAGLERLYQVDLAAPLPEAVRVPTVLAAGPYREFDALFYWED